MIHLHSEVIILCNDVGWCECNDCWKLLLRRILSNILMNVSTAFVTDFDNFVSKYLLNSHNYNGQYTMWTFSMSNLKWETYKLKYSWIYCIKCWHGNGIYRPHLTYIRTSEFQTSSNFWAEHRLLRVSLILCANLRMWLCAVLTKFRQSIK